MKDAKDIEQSQDHADHYDTIEDRFDAALHRNEPIHKPEQNAHDDQRNDEMHQRQGEPIVSPPAKRATDRPDCEHGEQAVQRMHSAALNCPPLQRGHLCCSQSRWGSHVGQLRCAASIFLFSPRYMPLALSALECASSHVNRALTLPVAMAMQESAAP